MATTSTNQRTDAQFRLGQDHITSPGTSRGRLGKRGAALRSSVIILAVLTAAVLTFLLQMLLSRSLSSTEFGLYALINSILAMSAPVASAGVAALLLRRKVRGEGGSIRTALVASGALCVIAALITVLVAAALGGGAGVPLLLSTLCFAMAGQAVSVSASQAGGEQGKVAVAQVILPLLRLLGGMTAVAVGARLFGVSVALAISGAASLCCFWVLKLRSDWTSEAWVPGAAVSFLRQSIPYSVNAVVNVAQLQLLVAISSAVFDLEVTGQIAIVMTLLAALYLLPNTVFGVILLPRYHRIIPREKGRWLPVYHSLLAACGALLLLPVVWWKGRELMELAFGSAGAAAYPLLAVVIWAVPLRFYSTGVGAALLSERAIRWKVPSSIAAVVMQASLCIFLAGRAEHVFAMAMIAGELLVAILYSTVLAREFRK